MFSLRCDYRENRGGCVITLLKNLRTAGEVISADKYELRDEVMTTGDYAIQCGGYIILVERKTWEDLAASIKDKRIFENHKKMLDARNHGYRIMYLIEGRAPNPESATIKVSGIPMANMMAKLDHFAMRDGVWVEYTRSAQHTAQRLLELGKNLLTLEARGCTREEETKSATTETNTTANVTGATITGGTDLIKQIENPDEIIKKKYEKTVAQVRESMLACIPGIGDKTARAMMNAVSFPKLITFNWSSSSSGLALNSFQTSELMALNAGDRPAIVIAMLKEIKGVSEGTARMIAAGFTIAKLTTRDTLTTAAIADMKINAAGRRIGAKLAERISVSWSDEVVTAEPVARVPATMQQPASATVQQPVPATTNPVS